MLDPGVQIMGKKQRLQHRQWHVRDKTQPTTELRTVQTDRDGPKQGEHIHSSCGSTLHVKKICEK